MSPKNHKHHHYNVALVDKVWNLKRLCEAQLKMHIPLNMVLKDDEYRADLLEKALSTGNDELVALVWEIRKMEDAILEAHNETDKIVARKKARYSFKLHLATIMACAFILFWAGYLFRSFLPIDAGEVFVLKAVQNVTVESRLKQKNTNVVVAGQLVKSDKPLFRLHGSNTVGEKLAARLVEAYLMSQGASNVHTDVGDNPVEKIVYGDVNGRTEWVEIKAHGSSTAFSDLLKGEADLGMSSRRIKDQERNDLLEKLGDLSLSNSEQVIGLDGLAIIVSPLNPVSDLSLAQLSDIYSGKITNWSHVGGKDALIKVFARDDKSGTYDTFKNLVLEKAKVDLSPNTLRVESSSELSDSVAKDPNAIGFIGLPYVRHAKAVAIASTGNNKSIVPTHFTVGTEDYPLSRRLYFYRPQTHANIEVDEFVNFAATERAQSIVEDVGLVSQNIKVGKPFDNDFYPPEMRDLVVRSQRLSLNFRFKPNSDELDSKSLADLERVAKFIEMNSPKRVQLFGFSDNEGDTTKSKSLSEARAKMVENLLIQRGIFPLVAKGMGDAAPLAASNTDEGRRMNRRVEVWML